MKSNKVLSCLLGTIFIIVLVSNFVSAFGVSTPNSVEVYPGQVMESSYLLSNLNSGEDVVVQAIMEDSAGIAEFVDSDLVYDLPSGSVAFVGVNISVPETTAIGTTYMVKALFAQVAGSETGGIQIILNIRSGLPIVVIAPPPGLIVDPPLDDHDEDDDHDEVEDHEDEDDDHDEVEDHEDEDDDHDED